MFRRIHNFVLWTDSLVMVFVTAICHSIQRWVGILSYRIAHHLAVLVVLTYGLTFFNYWLPIFNRLSIPSDLWISGFMTLGYWRIAVRVRRAEESFHRDPTALPRDIASMADRTFRAYFPYIIVGTVTLMGMFTDPHEVVRLRQVVRGRGLLGNWFVVNDLVSIWSLISFWYVIGVFPMPPAPSRLRQFVDLLKPVPKPVEVPNS